MMRPSILKMERGRSGATYSVAIVGTLILTYASWDLPRLLISGTDAVGLPLGFLAPVSVTTDVEKAWTYSLVSLFLSGIVLGLLQPKHWLTIAGTMLIVFLFAAIDGFIGKIHPSLRSEMLMDALLTAVGLVGVWVGKQTRHISNG